MGEYTQENRLIKVDTPLGHDVLLLRSFTGTEGISQLFRFELEMLSENRSIAFADIVGKNACIAVVLPDRKVRYIHGIISEFTQGGSTQLEGGTTPKIFAGYHATLVPQIWLLTHRTNCRIFQNKTVPEIIETIFGEHGFADYLNKLQGSFEKREYCVQYRESDFAFISRLMEEEGIGYFFEHEESRHVLIMANNPSEFKPCPLQASVSYKSVVGEERFEDIVTDWRAGNSVRPGQVTIDDFDFEKPNTTLTANIPGADVRQLELYDYPGAYRTRNQGERLAAIRMEEAQATAELIKGESTCRGLVPGFRFTLRDHYRRDFNQDYYITTLTHKADQPGNFRSDDTPELNYENKFICIPHPTPYRPARQTPVPVVRGSQTAIVVGPAGEEIHVDKYGRVKVQFHWDREGKYDDKSSCWVRVSQNWAGKRWGAMFIPRIGQEVIVDFLEGDPDQPIITGRVYNGEAMPPYELPGEKTKSTIKSNSSKGGGGFNEIRFEDKKGSEQIFIHGEKNLDVRIKNDRMEWIGNNQHLMVIKDQMEQVSGDKHLIVKGDQNEKVDGTVSLKAGMDLQQKVGMKAALDAGMEIHQKAGTNMMVESGTTLTIKSGVNLVIEAGVALTLKVGGNFVNLNPGGVFIQGTMVMINSGGAAGAAGSGAGCSPAAPRAPTEADKAEPGQMIELPPPKAPIMPQKYSPQALSFKKAAESGAPFCDT